jgi:sec-independent protein translocase protein TatA
VGSLSPWHWAILAVVVILLFGAKKLPDAARSLGKSMRIFKSELREMQTALGSQNEASAANPTPVQSQRVDAPAPSDKGHSEARPA